MKLKVFPFEINKLGAKCSQGKFLENFESEKIETTLNDFMTKHDVLKVDIHYHTIDRHNNGGSDLVMGFYHVWYNDKK